MSTKTMSIKKATLLNATSKYTNVITNLIFTIILARLLTPNDYGVIAVTTVFTNFFIILADMGIGTGIIQNKSLIDEEIVDIFSITVWLGIILAILFCFLGYPISIFYKNSIYVNICIVLSLSLLFNSLNMVPNALLMKNQEFIKVAVRNIVIPIITNIFAVILAFLGFKYYALVIQSILASFITFLWNYVTVSKKCKLKFRLKINFNGFNKIRSYSGYQFSFSIVNYFSRNLDNLLTSKFLGESLLGYYDKAYKLMLYPLNMLTNVITPSLHPILSRFQDNIEYIYIQYIKIIKILSICGIFIVVICFSASYEIIYIFFGKNWVPAVPCFRILSLSVWCQLLTSSTGAIFQSTNNTKGMLKTAIINTFITIVFISLGLSTGILEFMALGVTISYMLNYFITFKVLMNETFNMSLWRISKEILPDFLYMIFMILLSYFVFKYIKFSNVWISLLFKGLVELIIFILYLYISKKYKLFLDLIKNKG